MSESQGDASGKADCPACKLIGAGGCFAGAWYALFERARLPVNNRNRHWLGAIAIGESDIKYAAIEMGNGRHSYPVFLSYAVAIGLGVARLAT